MNPLRGSVYQADRAGVFILSCQRPVYLVTGYFLEFSQSIITSARLISRFLRSCSTSSKTSLRRSTAKRFMLASFHFFLALFWASETVKISPSSAYCLPAVAVAVCRSPPCVQYTLWCIVLSICFRSVEHGSIIH